MLLPLPHKVSLALMPKQGTLPHQSISDKTGPDQKFPEQLLAETQGQESQRFLLSESLGLREIVAKLRNW